MSRPAIVFLAFGLFATGHGAAQDAPKSFEGIWQGTLNAGGVKLRLVLNVERDDTGAYSGTMDSIDQGARDIPLDDVAVSEGEVVFKIPRLLVEFTGPFDSDGDRIVGTFTQGGASFPLTLERTDAEPVLNRPQEPKPPYPYREIEVDYDNRNAQGVHLAGTLTVPEGDGPFPSVLLITGSGAQNRDEELFGHKPFKVVADHLTRLGIAVLRVDDRGVGGSTGSMLEATSVDFVSDAEAGVDFLKTRPEVDVKRIGLIGHSEGGILAPAVAARRDDIAFIVLWAGPAVPGRDVVNDQIAGPLRRRGTPEAVIARVLELQEEFVDIAVGAEDTISAMQALRAAYDALTPTDRVIAGINDQNATAKLGVLASPWSRHFMSYDPRPALAEVTCPVLALFGEKDQQVSPALNEAEMTKALADNGGATVAVLPSLNHLFQTAETGSLDEYGTIEETVAPLALEMISEWILERTGG